MIVVGLSPAWQRTLSFRHLTLDAVNRAEDVAAYASGKVVNVALVLRQLDAPFRAFSVHGGVTGRRLADDLASLDLLFHWTETASETRVCSTLLDRSSGTVTELVENAGPLTDDEWEAVLDTIRQQASTDEPIVVSGSLPAGVPVSFVRDCCRAGGNAILDVRGAELREALEVRPLLIKPNREELAMTVGHPVDDEADVWKGMHSLADAGAANIVVSQGGGPLWGLLEGRRYRFQPPAVGVVNPIGSGDALTAGIAWGVTNGLPMVDAVRFGVACGTINTLAARPGFLSDSWQTGAEVRMRVEGMARQVGVEEH